MSEQTQSPTATLLLKSPDRKGLVHRISEFVTSHDGNILHADQHIDLESGLFFSRIEWDLESFLLGRDEIAPAFQPIAGALGMEWQLMFSDERPRIAIFVSKLDHCLVDLLHRWAIGELHGEIVVVVSNHPDLSEIAAQRNVPYHVFPIAPQTKASQEQKELELLRSLDVDLVVLARYMQIISPDFIASYPHRIINIHHSFLPAFVGANPYARAYERGVKLIGATSHYVTAELDQGPIVEQDVTRVSHRDTLHDLVRKGRDLERVVLARAVRAHVERRVLPFANKTVVFE